MLQASNKAAGGETARHQDTRAVSGGTPAAKLITHRKYKRFLGKYSITDLSKTQLNLDRRLSQIPTYYSTYLLISQ